MTYGSTMTYRQHAPLRMPSPAASGVWWDWNMVLDNYFTRLSIRPTPAAVLRLVASGRNLAPVEASGSVRQNPARTWKQRRCILYKQAYREAIKVTRWAEGTHTSTACTLSRSFVELWTPPRRGGRGMAWTTSHSDSWEDIGRSPSNWSRNVTW